MNKRNKRSIRKKEITKSGQLITSWERYERRRHKKRNNYLMMILTNVLRRDYTNLLPIHIYAHSSGWGRGKLIIIIIWDLRGAFQNIFWLISSINYHVGDEKKILWSSSCYMDKIVIVTISCLKLQFCGTYRWDEFYIFLNPTPYISVSHALLVYRKTHINMLPLSFICHTQRRRLF